LSDIRQAGNALSEYGLIGLLVLGVALAALTGLGLNLDDYLAGFGSAIVRKPIASGTNVAPSSINTSLVPNRTPSPTFGQPQLLLNGANFKNIGMAIQTVGANGATNELLATLEKQIMQLQAAGSIDETQANLLYQLANQGHTLAEAQKTLEAAFKQGQTSVTFQGRTYPIAEFADRIALDTQASAAELREVNPAIANSILKPFAEAYQQVKTSGMPSDPAIQKTINELVYKIMVVNDTLNWTAEDVIAAGYPDPALNFADSTLDHYVRNLGEPTITVESIRAASRTHKHSTQICTTGDGTDSGTQCTSQ
jgi:hypothetical protein